MSKWIRSSNELPPLNTDVLCYSDVAKGFACAITRMQGENLLALIYLTPQGASVSCSRENGGV